MTARWAHSPAPWISPLHQARIRVAVLRAEAAAMYGCCPPGEMRAFFVLKNEGAIAVNLVTHDFITFTVAPLIFDKRKITVTNLLIKTPVVWQRGNCHKWPWRSGMGLCSKPIMLFLDIFYKSRDLPAPPSSSPKFAFPTVQCSLLFVRQFPLPRQRWLHSFDCMYSSYKFLQD